MRCAVFYGPGKPLAIEERDLPKLGSLDALVKVAACGVCATDLHYIHGVPTFKKPPLILGHECSGIVGDLGDGVTGLGRGDHVILPPIISCGLCANCRIARDNICQNMVMVGNHVDGAFAEYVKAPAKDLVKLSDDLPLAESCIIADAVSTPFHAVKNRGKVSAGDLVVVFGCGGVGINAVQTASALGAIVFAVDVDERKLNLAREVGAVETVNARNEDVAKRIRDLTHGRGVDVAFEIVGKPAVMDQAFDVLKWGGRLVIVGYSSEAWNLKVSRLMFREMAIYGSLGCRATEYPRIIELVKAGKIRLQPVIAGRFRLEEVGEAFKALEEGKAAGRFIVIP